MLEQVRAALAAIEPAGAVAFELACPSDDLDLEVAGVGPLRFPISAATMRALLAVARPAPFGRRDKTLHDPSIRDTSEIGKGRIKIDARAWSRTLAPALEELRERLGLPAEGKLVAVLDKMLLYTPGQFFAAHQDSERDDDMIGSLVVTLPSVWSGGEVVVQHQGEKKIFRGAKRGPRDLSLFAFYADCRHEVRPVKSGHRIVLTYHLLHRLPAKPQRAAELPPSAPVERLTERVQAYFATPIAPRYGDDAPQRPDRLIYLLDHEYTEKSLGWMRLKNGDCRRVDALRHVADRLDCECWLALADVHENWTCDDEGWGRRGGRHRYDDDVEDAPTGEHALIDLCDSSVELRHWIARDVRNGDPAAPSVPVVPPGNEVCFTKATVDLEPFRSEHEGYMGNYGNTVDRWYHRAALVMWPRARDFVLRAKVSPAWAVSELVARISAGALPSAREGARELLPFWARHAPSEESAAFFPKLLTLAHALDDAELAHGLLAPFGPARLHARALLPFAATVERYGVAWSQSVGACWSERAQYAREARSWTALFPSLFAALDRKAPTHGRAFATWLLTREVKTFERARVAALSSPAIWLGDDQPGEHAESLRAILDGAARIDAVSTRDHLVTLLTTGSTALPPLAAGALLETCRKGRSEAAVRELGVEALFRYAVEAIERALAKKARAANDWSIELPLSCRCALCATLVAFLIDQTRTQHSWPLAERGRQHVHGVIDRHRLPVTHVTTRRGSPYTLVLTKQPTIFEREAALRARAAGLLAWLKSNRKAFVGRARR